MKYLPILALFICANAFGTTWGETKVTDPISGTKTKTYEINSYGSYIYSWPSKYHGIFWPLTDEKYIRFNQKSGYIAFGSDFEDIKEEDIQKIRDFLKENYDKKRPPETHIQKLRWLKEVQSARGSTPELEIKILCTIVYLSEDEEVESENRQSALRKIEEYISESKPSFYSAHLRVVAGYYFYLEDEKGKAEEYWDSVATSDLGIMDEEESKGSREYLVGIVSELKEQLTEEANKTVDTTPASAAVVSP